MNNNFAEFMNSARNCVMLCDTNDDCHAMAHEDSYRLGPMSGPGAFKYSHGPNGLHTRARRRWVAEVNSYWNQIYLLSGQ